MLTGLDFQVKTFFQVKWKKSDVKFEDRFDKYLDPSFFQHRVGKLCMLRYSVCAPISLANINEHLPCVGHCVRAVDFRGVTDDLSTMRMMRGPLEGKVRVQLRVCEFCSVYKKSK